MLPQQQQTPPLVPPPLPPPTPKRNDDETSALARATLVFCAHKSGMDTSSAGTKSVNERVYELSKNSKYFKKAARNNMSTTMRIEKMKKKMKNLRNMRYFGSEEQRYAKIRRYMDTLRSHADMSRTFVVVDLDQFYAAVEIREDPSLAGKPIAVGGMSMISTSNYEARKFGVRSAMPGFIGKQLCPELILVKGHFHLYREVGEAIRKIFREYDANFRSMSLDEASLEVTNYIRAYNDTHSEPIDGDFVASEIRQRIFESQRITASAGVAATRTLAKICSNRNKPNGQFVLRNSIDEIHKFLDELPLREYPGIGKVTERVLTEGCGFSCVGEMRRDHNAFMIKHVFSDVTASYLLRASLGVTSGFGEVTDEDQQDTDLNSGLNRKSCSRERTFRALFKLSDLQRKLQEVAAKLADDMHKHHLEASHVTLKLKSVEFDVASRSVSLSRYICKANDIHQYASKLLQEEFHRQRRVQTAKLLPPVSYRLLGIRLANLRAKSSKQATVADVAAMFGVDEDEVMLNGECDVGEDDGDDVCDEEENSPVSDASVSKSSSLKFASITDQFQQMSDKPPPPQFPCPNCMSEFTGLTALNLHLNSCLATNTKMTTAATPTKPTKSKTRKQHRQQQSHHHNIEDLFARRRSEKKKKKR